MDAPILPAFYFGSVEHYRLLAQYPRVVIDTGEHYVRQSYRTRTAILGPNGRQGLVVPIARRSGEKMPMRTVGLSYEETWPQQHLHAIRTAYGQAPWTLHFIDDIAAVLLRRYERLIDLDLATMRLGMQWLGLKTELVVSEEYVEEANGEWPMANGGLPYRSSPFSTDHSPSAGNHSSFTHQLLDLRTTLYPKKPLPAEVPAVPHYPQVFADRHGFTPRLSVIDLVCNCGPEAQHHLLA
ncbi:MAG: WbqC family protein [Flavobacteriales bacterium]